MSAITGLDAEQIIAQYGAYFRNSTISKKNLQDQVFTTSDIKNRFNTQPTESTIVDNVNVVMTNILQAFFPKFSAKGTLGFTPNVFQLDRVKINHENQPDVLYNTALNFLVQKGVYREEAPLGEIVAQYLIMKAKEEEEEEVAFFGVRALPTPEEQATGKAGTTVGSRDGIRKKIRTYNTAGNSGIITMGSVPTDAVEYVEYVREFYQSINQKLRPMVDGIEIPEINKDLYMDGMDSKYNTHYNRDGGLLRIHNTTVGVYCHRAMNGSDMIWAATKRNRVGFIKGVKNKSVFNIQAPDFYQVKFASDWAETYDFVNPAEVFHNDQDLSD